VNLIKKMLVAPAAVLALWAVTAQATTNEAIAERLKPPGEVCVMGEECKGVGAVAVVAGSAARSTDSIITAHCSACHTPGILGAPMIGDTAAWKARADKEGGIDGILATAIAGINAMPAKGTCADCSDDELRDAIVKMSGL
jgi:cytochrome c5